MTQATEAQDRTSTSRRQQASSALENNPLAVVAGGVALGVVLGALIPRPDKERELLAPVGKRIAEGASAAAAAARESGKAEIGALLPGGDAARDQIGKIIGDVFTAARESGRTNTRA